MRLARGGSGSRQAGQNTAVGSWMDAPQCGQAAGPAAGAGAPSRLRYSCMIVGGAGRHPPRRPLRGRFAPQVKQMRSLGLTSAAQAGQVRVAMSSSRDGGWCGHVREMPHGR